ncbi:hypothetical protein EVAR_99244_1 [Eumeta japonica]|uniref:Uncharacterized protein n=1 Tax=Eumeta variegata TaxID=151549 RepID=A0A4C2A1W2_EUMVA|nr:hypothetical protein EVAR_99244_1 [Eumeta japonica]
MTIHSFFFFHPKKLVRRRRIRISIEIFKAVTGRKRPPATDKRPRDEEARIKQLRAAAAASMTITVLIPACAEPTET